MDVPPGIDLGLVFDNAVLNRVANERLIIVLEYEDDSGFQWRSEAPLHRENTDHLDRQRWRVGAVTTRLV